ncbi:hypothetical protein IDJ81_13690 [Tsuneonella flava]|uniref:Uncharacterized protein n=1 Tax=Tsuneonella flava TaxID=2055955 RepID=A0ABX7KB95_9SPHN|nr:hypothetical protein [Tsuneonella flava]QSB44326.1 hypothetical protein IDJ81_13555 [Tsuneonella flava]QSB44349.1 hypothetical protein IDJ81_13690 [Tsuneonella flava]
MLTIATAASLAHVLRAGCDPGLSSILKRYQPLMAEEQLAVLYVLQPGDRRQDLEAARGCPFEQWEFIVADGGWYEAVFVLDDYGHGHVVLIPDSTECDPELLAICRGHAVPHG